MFRCMIEEYLLSGHSIVDIRSMCAQPNYQAFYAAFRSLGPTRAETILSETAARIGRHRVRFVESTDQAQEATLTVNATSSPSTDREGETHA